MSLSPCRQTYRPSGRVDWPRLAWALPPAMVWSGVVASFFCLLIALGWYILAMTVLLPAGISAGLARWIVRNTHCRNQVLAGLLSGVMGLAGYVVYLHSDQCLRWGVTWTAVDRLPGYVTFRMETDRWRFEGKGARLVPARPAPGVIPWRGLAGVNFLTMNWGLLLLDVGILLLVPLASGAYAAGQPYSESRRRWCDCEKLILAQSAGKSLSAALAANQMEAWVLGRPRKVGEHEPHVTVSVWYTPRGKGNDVDWEVFLAIDSGPRWRLAPAEAADLTVLLPALQDLAESTEERLAAEAAQMPGGAQIHPVPPPYAGQAQNERTMLWGHLLVWTAMIVPGVLACALLPGGVCLLAVAIQHQLLPIWTEVVYVVVVGLSLLVSMSYWYNTERPMCFELGRRLDDWLLRRAIRQRPSPRVSADDLDAVIVEMSPRRLWGRGFTPPPGEFNQGLLLCDWEHEKLLFEGDYACYEIPAAAILDCHVEGLPGSGSNTSGLFGVILQVQVGIGVLELPLFPMRSFVTGNRWQQAWALHAEIETLCGREFGEQPSEPPPAPPLRVC